MAEKREREASHAEVIEGLKPVCVCKGIRKKVFLQHIAAGRETVEDIRKATGAGSVPARENGAHRRSGSC